MSYSSPAAAVTRSLPIALAALVLTATAAPAVADSPGPLRPAGATGRLGDERLSDERTVSRVGRPTRIYKIRSGPGRHHHTIGMLRFLTEDNAPEIYLVLRSKLGRNGHPWLQIRVPRRPNGSKGWVPRSALSRLKVLTTSLEIDKRAAEGPAVQGRQGDLDGEPRDRRVRHADPERPLLDPRAARRTSAAAPPYGPLAFGTAAYSRLSDWPGGGVVGIHGTNAPGPHPRPPVARLHPRAATTRSCSSRG